MKNFSIQSGITLDIHPDYQSFVQLKEERLLEFRLCIALHGLGEALALHAIGHRIIKIRMPSLKERPVCRIESKHPEIAVQHTSPDIDKHVALGRICRLVAGFVAEYLCEGTEYGSVTSIDEWYDAQIQSKDFASRHSLPHHHVLTACFCAVESYLGKCVDPLESTAAYLAKMDGQQLQSPRRGYLFEDVPRCDLGKAAYELLSADWLEEECDRVERLMP